MQAQRIDRLIDELKRNKKNALVFVQQRVVVNTTSTPMMQCIQDRLYQNRSIFSCYGRYDDVIEAHSKKSFYLRYKCPNTGFHESVNIHGQERHYDCGDGDNYAKRMEPSKPENTGRDEYCALMHLAINQKLFDAPRCNALQFSKSRLALIRNVSNYELLQIADDSSS
jgi:hypothetical protein